MRHAIGLTFLAALAMPAPADDKPGGDDKLVGTWSLTVLATPRKTEDQPEGAQTITFVKGGKLILAEKGRPHTMGTWKADPDRMPHELDLVFVPRGLSEAETLKTIYRIDGDKLEIAMSSNGRDPDRPKVIDPKESQVGVFKRQKP
jgi:uncharacterized protein (TIGR03067 family)